MRQELAAAHTRAQILTYLGYRARTAMANGRPPGPETSVMKLFMADHLARSGSLAKALAGRGRHARRRGARRSGHRPSDGHGAASARLRTWRFLHAPSIGIAGGSNEVQRWIIGERVLGLPRDPKPAELRAGWVRVGPRTPQLGSATVAEIPDPEQPTAAAVDVGRERVGAGRPADPEPGGPA